MSAALQRIILRVIEHSTSAEEQPPQDSYPVDSSICWGDMKDAITVELHATKTRIEAVLLKIDLLYGPIGPAVDYVNEIRAIMKDL